MKYVNGYHIEEVFGGMLKCDASPREGDSGDEEKAFCSLSWVLTHVWVTESSHNECPQQKSGLRTNIDQLQ